MKGHGWYLNSLIELKSTSLWNFFLSSTPCFFFDSKLIAKPLVDLGLVYTFKVKFRKEVINLTKVGCNIISLNTYVREF